VPEVVGLTVLAACRELRTDGYTGAVFGEVGNPRSGPSRVVAQKPEAGRKGDEGELVRLTVSRPYPARVLEQNPECLDRTQFGPGGKPNRRDPGRSLS
jgi:beta-lactam-binding protein with PASTA domain